MLRMGKNPKVEQHSESENTMDSKATPQYNTPQTYNSYQSQQPAQPQAAAQPQAYRPAPEAGSNPRVAVTESESLARDIKEGTLSGFVGNGTVLTGEATFKAMLRIDGHMTGRVSSETGTLIVGNNGQVDANIEVAVAIIQGTVNGDIVATQRLELGRAAKVNGNIQTPSLVIEQGAIFEGSCRMAQPRAAQEKKDKTSTDDAAEISGNGLLADESANVPGDFSSISEIAS